MTHTLNLDEYGFNFKETKKITKSFSKKDDSYIRGEVEIRDAFGNLLQKKRNIIPLGGRRFTLEKLFNIEANENKRKTLNEIFGINTTSETKNYDGPIQRKEVCLFGIGNGGSGIEFGNVYVPTEREYNLYNMIPFRLVNVENDLSDTEKEKYYLRVPVIPSTTGNGLKTVSESEAEYFAYYLKKFEKEPELIIKSKGEEYFPKEEDNVPITSEELNERTDVDIYIELSLKITEDDVREYYLETENDINKARINELGVFLGYQPEHIEGIYTDYKEIEDFSKLCFNNEPLDDETKELNIIYRFFI